MKIKTAILLLGASVALAAAAPPQNTLTPEEKSAGWQLLFDGRSIDDWRASDQLGTFSVKDGEIVVKGPRSHLFYLGAVGNHDFRNFELKADVYTYPKANSGVYFHTHWQAVGWPDDGFEVQVNNSHSDPKRTAGLYDVRDVYIAPAADYEWFTLDIRVTGKHVITLVNGRVIVDYTEPDTWVPPPNHPGRRIGHGTFALQGHDPGSEIHYRNIKVLELP